jgi:hypothetical protein
MTELIVYLVFTTVSSTILILDWTLDHIDAGFDERGPNKIWHLKNVRVGKLFRNIDDIHSESSV